MRIRDCLLAVLALLFALQTPLCIGACGELHAGEPTGAQPSAEVSCHEVAFEATDVGVFAGGNPGERPVEAMRCCRAESRVSFLQRPGSTVSVSAAPLGCADRRLVEVSPHRGDLEPVHRARARARPTLDLYLHHSVFRI